MTQPLPEQPQVDEAEEQQSLRDRLNDRKVLAAIGAAVVVVAALGLFVVKPMLTGSSSNDSSFVVQHHPAKAKASASASPSAPAVAATPAPQLKVRDPFSPLVVVPVTAPASPDATAPPAGSSTQSPPVVPSSSPSRTTYVLKLDKIVDAKTAQITLNGTPLTVTVGQGFPSATEGPFALMKIVAGGPAQFTYGDSPFDMAVGEIQTES